MRTFRRALAASAVAALTVGSMFFAAPAVAAPADTVAPTVVVTAPTEGHVYQGGGGYVSFSTADASGLTWQVLVDGAFHYGGSEAGGASVYLPIGSLANGAHTVSVVATDPSLNSTSVTRNFTVDRIGPDVYLTAPANGSWVSDGADFTIAYNAEENLPSWKVEVDDTVVDSGAFYSGSSRPHRPSGWVDGSQHTVKVTGADGLGRTNSASATVTADAAPPTVTVIGGAGTLTRASSIGGTAVDSVSGVASVRVAFLEFDGETCGAEAFDVDATLTGTNWTAGLPAAAEDGEFCLVASATDRAGRTASTAPVQIDIDVSGPAAPTGLAPTGSLLESPSVLSWSAAAEAVSYQYRAASDLGSLDGAALLSTTTTSGALSTAFEGTFYWQVRGVDVHGNYGDWSTPAEVTVIGAPTLDCLCGFVGGSLSLSWSSIPDAVSYRFEVTGTDKHGDPVVAKFQRSGSVTSTTYDFASSFPTGVISVRVRAELPGGAFTAWSSEQRTLRLGAPKKPTLVTPASGAYVDGEDVELKWKDDSSVLLWEVRVSPSRELGEDGGLGGDDADGGVLVDPMVLVVVIGGGGGLPEDVPIDLDEIDALLTCDVLDEFVGAEIPLECADGSVTIPETLDDGHYFWQVRGIGIDGLMSSMSKTGPWSKVGHFVVGEKPVKSGGDGGSTDAGSGTDGGDARTTTSTSAGDAPVVEPVVDETDETDEPATEEPAEEEPTDNGTDGGASAGEPQAAAVDADNGLPLGWIIGGIAGLVVIAGAVALIQFLRVRAR